MKQIDKNQLEQAFHDSDIPSVEALPHDFHDIYPHDRDLSFYQCIYFLTIEHYEQAQNIITDCLRKFPTCYECYY